MDCIPTDKDEAKLEEIRKKGTRKRSAANIVLAVDIIHLLN